MKIKHLPLALLLAVIPSAASAEWKIDPLWGGIINMSDNGTPVSITVTRYNGIDANITIPAILSCSRWENVNGDDTAVETMTLPVAGIDNFYSETNLMSVTVSSGIRYVNDFHVSDKLKVSFEGDLESVSNSFNAVPFGNISHAGIKRVFQSFNNSSETITGDILAGIESIEESFECASVPEVFRLPSGLKSLRGCSWAVNQKDYILICSESLDTIDCTLNRMQKVVLGRNCVFRINVSTNSEIYYPGTKEEFIDRLTHIHQYSPELHDLWIGDNSIFSTNYSSNHKIFTDSEVSETGEPSGILWTELTWPESAPIIPQNFLCGYRFLEKVTIPAIDRICENAFYKTCRIKELSVNARLIENEAFAADELNGDYTQTNYATYTRITLGSNIKKLGSDVFRRSSVENLIAEMDIKDWLGIERNEKTFNSMSVGNLIIDNKEIEGVMEIPSGVTEIPSCAFPGNRIKNLIIPSSVETVGALAMYGSQQLVSVKFEPAGTRSGGGLAIGRQAFSYCTNLTEIIFDRTPDRIGANAFSDTPWYDSKPDGAVTIGNAFYAHKGYEAPADGSYRVSEGIQVVCADAFDNIKSDIVSLYLPSTLAVLEPQCNLSCLKEIYARSESPNEYVSEDGYLLPQQFYEKAAGCTIYVPEDAVGAYRDAKGWNAAWFMYDGNIYKSEGSDTNIRSYDFGGIAVAEEDRCFTIDGLDIHLSGSTGHYAVFNIAGREIATDASGKSVRLPGNGIYIIIVDGKAFKIAVR